MPQTKPRRTRARSNEVPSISRALLDWYDAHARTLPWRVPPRRSRTGERPDPYKVWLSEVMLQQTTVAAVRPRYERFLRRWPTVRDLAAASEVEVLGEWAGLGYYRRARSLHACARELVERHHGQVPRTAEQLRALPGIGDYMAAAVAAIAFGEAVPVIDGNVERVVSRLIALDVPPARARAKVRGFVADRVPANRPGDFAQATMDLGATICTPRAPACALCPIAEHCAAFAAGEPERWPLREPKRARPTRRGAAYLACRSDGALLMTRRGDDGVLAGTASVPMSGWSAASDGTTDASDAPFEAEWSHVGIATHGFTHFEIVLDVHRALVDREAPAGCWWSRDPESEGLTTLMRKVLAAAGLSQPFTAPSDRPDTR